MTALGWWVRSYPSRHERGYMQSAIWTHGDCGSLYTRVSSGSPRLCREVNHANQEGAPRSRVLSRSVANVGRASRQKLMSNVVIASSVDEKNSWRSSVAMTLVRADLGGDFKRCCMQSGEFDGSDRHYFF